jgi:DNA-directed RNA polymerase specialized sigma24 family protein
MDPKFKLFPSDVEHVGKLGRHLTDVLALAHEGHGYRSISRALTIPVGTVKSRLSRARIAITKMRAKTT